MRLSQELGLAKAEVEEIRSKLEEMRSAAILAEAPPGHLPSTNHSTMAEAVEGSQSSIFVGGDSAEPRQLIRLARGRSLVADMDNIAADGSEMEDPSQSLDSPPRRRSSRQQSVGGPLWWEAAAVANDLARKRMPARGSPLSKGSAPADQPPRGTSRMRTDHTKDAGPSASPVRPAGELEGEEASTPPMSMPVGRSPVGQHSAVSSPQREGELDEQADIETQRREGDSSGFNTPVSDGSTTEDEELPQPQPQPEPQPRPLYVPQIQLLLCKPVEFLGVQGSECSLAELGFWELLGRKMVILEDLRGPEETTADAAKRWVQLNVSGKTPGEKARLLINLRVDHSSHAKGYVAEILNCLLCPGFPFVCAAHDTAQGEGRGVKAIGSRKTGAYDGVMVVRRRWARAVGAVLPFAFQCLHLNRSIPDEHQREELMELQSEGKTTQYSVGCARRRGRAGFRQLKLECNFGCAATGKLVMIAILLQSCPCIAVVACFGTPLEEYLCSRSGNLRASCAWRQGASMAEAEFEALAKMTAHDHLRRRPTKCKQTPALHSFHLIALVHID